MQISFGSLWDATTALTPFWSAKRTGRSCSLARSRRHACAGAAFSRSRRRTSAMAPSDRARTCAFRSCARKFAARRSAPCVFPASSTISSACQRERLRKADLLNAHLASLIPLAEGLRMVLRDHLLSSPGPFDRRARDSGCGTGGSAPASPRISWRYARRWPTRRAYRRACFATYGARLLAELGSSDGQGAPVPADRADGRGATRTARRENASRRTRRIDISAGRLA